MVILIVIIIRSIYPLLLDKNFKNSNFIIKNSNIFYRNKENEVLFINKIINLKYYYDVKVLRNIFISKNEIP